MAHRTSGATAVVAAIGFLLIHSSAFAEIALTQVEIKLERMSGGGCSHCGGFSKSYDVVIRGDGTVEYRDGGEPDHVSVRSVSTDDVIVLANEFIAAGFLEARDAYRGKFGLVRQGNGVLLKNFGPKSDAPEIRLMVRIGERVKRVSLVEDYPEALGRLPELVDRMGGPNAWAGR
jgi:hypothetical protein